MLCQPVNLCERKIRETMRNLYLLLAAPRIGAGSRAALAPTAFRPPALSLASGQCHWTSVWHLPLKLPLHQPLQLLKYNVGYPFGLSAQDCVKKLN